MGLAQPSRTGLYENSADACVSRWLAMGVVVKPLLANYILASSCSRFCVTVVRKFSVGMCLSEIRDEWRHEEAVLSGMEAPRRTNGTLSIQVPWLVMIASFHRNPTSTCTIIVLSHWPVTQLCASRDARGSWRLVSLIALSHDVLLALVQFFFFFLVFSYVHRQTWGVREFNLYVL